VTAGGRVNEAFAAAIARRSRRWRPRQRRLTRYRPGAIAGAGIDGVAVVGGPEVELHLRGAARVIPAAPDGATNVARALDAWPAGDDLLFATSDLPFVTASDLAAFLAASAATI